MTRGRLLLIEDEPALARGLSDTLRAQGFDVTIAADGAQGLDAATSGAADMILLDVMLPKVNGYEICRAVRAHGLDVPILMLTAKGQEADVVLGLNLGADSLRASGRSCGAAGQLPRWWRSATARWILWHDGRRARARPSI